VALKIGKGLGKLLEAAGLAHEVPDEPEEKAAEGRSGEENRPAEPAAAEGAVGKKTDSAASKKGSGSKGKIPDEKPAAVSSRLTEDLRSALEQAPSADVYRRFREHGDALAGFIDDEAKRILAAAKAAKITKPEITTALSSRMKALDAAVENMRAESLSEIRQKLGKSESELKQVRTSISTKEQELGDLRSQADTLDSQISSLRQKVDAVQQRIQAAYEQTRAEIGAEQEMVKKYLK
jgi:outer membrane murein-binding lipoprotein Lpp